MGAALARAGLDVRNLPPLESLAPGPKQRVMRTFTEALGIPCFDCHSEDDFKADTRRKRVARRMWNEIVRVLATRDDEPVYCDSCHDGAIFHLDRADAKLIAGYMCNVMVGGFKRVDGRTHDCTTCHGDPPDFELLANWKLSAAPDITHDANTPQVIVPTWPIERLRAPADCGGNGERCPLNAWMRLVVAPAASKLDDRQGLATALERVALFAPEDESFVRAAKTAAAVARSGDRAKLRDACGACHAEHKATWRERHRTRAPSSASAEGAPPRVVGARAPN
jgi:hypothetical protein